MITVGIKQIKNRLSEYLRKAKAGERVVVTERGRPIAVITRPGGVAEVFDFTLGTHPISRKGTTELGRSEATKRLCLFTSSLPGFSNWIFSLQVFLYRISLLSR